MSLSSLLSHLSLWWQFFLPKFDFLITFLLAVWFSHDLFQATSSMHALHNLGEQIPAF